MTGAEVSPNENESTDRNIEAGEEQPLLTSPPAPVHDDDTSGRNVIVTAFWKSGPALALGTILFGADYALATASFPKIGSDFAQLRHVTWLTISFTVGVAASQPLYSRLSDVYGRKPLQLASYVCFAIGLIFCVVSPQFWWLVVARGVVGIGSSGMAYMVALILNDEIALQDRATWQGGLQLMALVGDFIGGPLGGALLDRLGWRWAFCLEIPVAALVFALVLWTLKAPQTPMQKPDALSSNDNCNGSPSSIVTSRFDFLGSLNLILLVATFVLALNIAGNDVPWSHPLVPVLLSLGTLLLATFIYVELSPSRKPLIPVRLFLSRSLWSIAGVTFFKEMALMAYWISWLSFSIT